VSATTLGSLARAVRDGGATEVTEDAGRARVDCRLSPSDVPALADELERLGLEPQLVIAVDTRNSVGGFTLRYAFAPPTHRPLVTARVPLGAGETRFTSLATRSFAASRFEREIQDLFGLTPVGHPDARRLALHQFWPAGYHPLRRDTAPRSDFVDRGEPFPFRRVEGDGLLEITVGPVHAGIIEPGHFRFSVEGETIINLETRLGFVHKGIEKLFETLPFARTPELAERISGDTSVAHRLAFCQALEALAGCTPPRRAAWLRVVLLELERLYNHVGDVGMILNDTGYAFAHAHCFRLREELFRLNARLTGHRLLRGAIVPGGVTETPASAGLAAAGDDVARIVREFLQVAVLALDNTMVLERLQGTGRLTPRTAREMQVVGLVGRASGLDEAQQSASLIGTAAAAAGNGAWAVPLGELRAGADAIALVEGWRGPLWYWLTADGPASLARVKVVDPSFRNWPALEYAVLNNIVPDFPLCNKSFNLSYSGADL
jgi:Ni,Fe-hydrogenase III large subunit/Ni,Fe-hydrogenase III component G